MLVLGMKRTNVVRLAIVCRLSVKLFNTVRFRLTVPGDDLSHLRAELEELLPATGPEVVAGENPVLAVGVRPEVREEPRANRWY